MRPGRPFVAVLTAVGMLVLAAGTAAAAFGASASSSGTFATLVVQPATALTAADTCDARDVAGADLNWQLSPTPEVDGYEILRFRDGILEHADHVPATSTAYHDTGLATGRTTYRWEVRATVSTWRSAPVEASAATRNNCGGPPPRGNA